MATTATVSVEEYLKNPKYEFCEYLDGVIREKYPVGEGAPLVNSVHGLLVGIIIQWFGVNRKEWRVKTGPEVTTFISPTRTRLPDVSVVPFGPSDEYQFTPPLIAIEVLSASNTKAVMLSKLEDYSRMGIPNVWVIDPQTRSGRQYRGAESTDTNRFEVPGTAIYMDLSLLFAQFDEENQPIVE